MKLTLGFSPCPNDTFIFDALVNKKIDCGNFIFEPVLEDIETLNKWSTGVQLDITKLSFPAFFRSLQNYIALPSGGALGNGVGPLLVAKKQIPDNEIDALRIAIPGENTTANFLLSFAFPNAKNRIPVLFSTIEEAIIKNDADVGVLIHENRFTYHRRGLVKLMDLGEYWQTKTGLPIPLACIAIKKNIDKEVQEQVGRLIRKSVEYALFNYPLIAPYVKAHSQAMEEEVMRKHIDLYVNNFSIDLGEIGRTAIEKFYEVFTTTQSARPLLFV